jgi:hypothetical protein
MKALTLTQPWATLVAIGAKRIETRSWRTNYRGPLAIHAAKAFPRDCRELGWAQPFRCALHHAGIFPNAGAQWELPLGKILATCRLVDCVPTEYMDAKTCPFRDLMTPLEMAFGDYSPKRYAWILDGIEALGQAVAAKGALGLWEWDPGTETLS